MSSLDTRAIEEKELKEAPCPAARQEFRVFLAEAAFDRAVARGDGDTTREIGGVLVGEVLRDAAGPYLRVDTTIDALHADEKGAELTFTHATWDHIHKEMDGKHKDKRVVGWYHTHPGFGIFLSDRDQFIHKSFFNLPFQIALVYDPKAREHGVFVWHDNEVWRARRYFVGSREQLWDGSRAHENPERAAASAVDMKVAKAETSSSKDASDEPLFPASPTTLVVAAAVLMLIAGFVGHWIGASSGNAALVEAQGELEKARHEGEQFAIGQLNADLVGVLRDTIGDQALHKPVAEAITAIDAAIASMEPKAAGSAAGSGSGTGSGSGSGTGSGSGSGSGSGTATVLAQLKQARDILARLGNDRSSSATALEMLERASKSESMLKADLAHDVAEQRAAIGIAFTELSANALKGGDKDRAMRLLAVAAHVDPGNRARYEQQLHAIDPAANLPPGGTQ